MKLCHTLKSQLEDKIKQTVDTLNEIYNFSLAYPEYHFDIKGTTAGVAKSKSMTIHFNYILAINNWEDFINTTVPHEICHLGVFKYVQLNKLNKYPSPHGPTWKLMMYEVGASSKTTHDFDVDLVKKNRKEYEYECNCADKIVVSSNIHNKIKNGYKYICKKCKTELKNGIMKRKLLLKAELLKNGQ